MSYGYGAAYPDPEEVAARFEHTYIDGDDEPAASSYQYPDLDDESDVDGLPPFPFFQSADPALRSAYSYGDPRAQGSAYPDLPALGAPQPKVAPRIVYEGEDDNTAVPDLDNGLQNPFGFNNTRARTGKQAVDPDFENSNSNDDEDDDEDGSTEDESDAPQPTPKRGRGRGRGRGSRGASQAQASSRGRGKGRGGGRGRGRGRGKKLDAMFAEDTPSSASDADFPAQVKRRKKKNKNNVVITPEFRILNARMTKEWLAQNYQEALDVGLQVIKMNPHVFEVHAMISEILTKLGRHEDAVGALFTGAFASQDPETWRYVVGRFKEIKDPNRDINNKIRLCYDQILAYRRSDYPARLARMYWMKDNYYLLKARSDCIRLLEQGMALEPDAERPNAEVCREMVSMSLSINDTLPAIPKLEAFVDYCMEKFNPDDEELSWSLLNDFADIYLAAKKHTEGLALITRASRWVLGRADETCWDELDDDREWDFEHEPRRLQVEDFDPERYDLDQYGGVLPIELRAKLGLFRVNMGPNYHAEGLQHFDDLLYDDIPETEIVQNNDLYREIADILREAGLHQEALKFYIPLRKVDGLLSSNDFFMLAICYQALDDQAAVQGCIQEISSGSTTGDVSFQIGLAKLCQAQGQERKMWKLISTLRRNGNTEQIKKAGLPLEKPFEALTEASSGEADDVVDRAVAIGDYPLRKKLKGSKAVRPERPPRIAKIPLPRPPKAPKMPKARVRSMSSGSDEQSVPVPRKYRPRAASPASIERLKEPIIRGIFNELKACEGRIEGEHFESPAWLSLVHELWHDYKTQGRFYGDGSRTRPFVGPGRDRFVSVPEDSTLMNETEFVWAERPEYRGVKIDQWVAVLTEYAVSLAKLDQADHCWEVVKSVDDSNVVYCNKERRRVVKTAAIMCALILEDEQKLCECGRYFIHQFPYQTDVYRLFSAMNTIVRGPRTWFNSGPEQKYLARAVKSMDFALLDPKHYDDFGLTLVDKARLTQNGKTDGNPHHLLQHDPALLALYGHFMLVAGSCTTALTYYFRAYALVPDDIVLNLCMGICYLQLAFKRLVDNRQSHVQQGLSLIYRYYENRMKTEVAVHQQEAEFNLALVWHTLGLLHLAIPQYEKVIKLSGRVHEEAANKMDEGVGSAMVEDFAVEAAYSLQLIFATSGDMFNARRVTRDWMVI